jgi:hypothetical protein
MAGADSISAKQISAAARTSAAKLVEQHKPQLGTTKFDIGFCPPPWWWIGIILHKPPVISIADADKMASELQRAIGSAVPSVKNAQHGAVLLDGNLTIGFVAPKELNIIQE